jgi:hypothetical protein
MELCQHELFFMLSVKHIFKFNLKRKKYKLMKKKSNVGVPSLDLVN